MKIVKEDGKIYGVEETVSYGVKHITKVYLGDALSDSDKVHLGDDDKPKSVKKTKKKQKMDDEK